MWDTMNTENLNGFKCKCLSRLIKKQYAYGFLNMVMWLFSFLSYPDPHMSTEYYVSRTSEIFDIKMERAMILPFKVLTITLIDALINQDLPLVCYLLIKPQNVYLHIPDFFSSLLSLSLSSRCTNSSPSLSPSDLSVSLSSVLSSCLSWSMSSGYPSSSLVLETSSSWPRCAEKEEGNRKQVLWLA